MLLVGEARYPFGSDEITPGLPLGAGTRSFWYQEGPMDTAYSLDFQVSSVPEPTSMTGLALLAVTTTMALRVALRKDPDQNTLTERCVGFRGFQEATSAGDSPSDCARETGRPRPVSCTERKIM